MSTSQITMADVQSYEIPKACKAGVVIDEGPYFKLGVEDVAVPEPGEYVWYRVGKFLANT
jgi:hypothetical protein